MGNSEGDPSLPPKFLDGVFDGVEVERQDGSWVSVETQATLSVGAGTGPISVPIPADVPRFGSTALTDIVLAAAGVTQDALVDLGLDTADRVTFGQRFRVVLRP